MNLPNLIKLFAQKIYNGEWPEENVPNEIRDGVREEVKRLSQEENNPNQPDA